MRKIRQILTLLAIMLVIPTIKGETAQQVVNAVINSYNKSKIVAADYTLTANGMNSSGVIIMSQQRFTIQSEPIKCWYDGKTQWSYLSQVGEVNITEPTAEELVMTNPYAALKKIDSNYVADLAVEGGNYKLTLVPKTNTEFATQIVLTINKSTKQITKALFHNQDNSKYIITIGNYRTDSKYTDKVFSYDPSQLPAGVPVIDLR